MFESSKVYTSGCKDIEHRKNKFAAKTQILYDSNQTLNLNVFTIYSALLLMQSCYSGSSAIHAVMLFRQ